jgi:hypothetical protein
MRNRSLQFESLEQRSMFNADVNPVTEVNVLDATPPRILDVVDVAPDPHLATEGGVRSVVVIFDEEIQLASFTRTDIQLTSNGNNVSIPAQVTISQLSSTRYRIANLQESTRVTGNYVLTINGNFTNLSGISGNSSANDSWFQNARPWIGVEGNVNYREGQAPIKLAPAALVKPVTQVYEGTLRLKISMNRIESNEFLTVENQGSGPGQVGTIPDGTERGTLTYEGNPIGGYSRDFTGSLNIDMQQSTSPAVVQTIARAVLYIRTGEILINESKSVGFNLSYLVNPAIGTQSIKTLNLVPNNDRPILGGFGGSLSYTRETAATQIAPAATVTDADNTQFSGGVLTVRAAIGGHANDRLTFGGVFAQVGNLLQDNGNTIGTINTNGGVGLTELQITFNGAASQTVMQRLLQQIRFSTIAGAPTGQRRIEFVLTDGSGGTSNIGAKIVNVL